jgi:hypothetical protein
MIQIDGSRSRSGIPDIDELTIDRARSVKKHSTHPGSQLQINKLESQAAPNPRPRGLHFCSVRGLKDATAKLAGAVYRKGIVADGPHLSAPGISRI